MSGISCRWNSPRVPIRRLAFLRWGPHLFTETCVLIQTLPTMVFTMMEFLCMFICSILYDKMKSNSACLVLIFIRILVVMGAKQVWFLYLFHWSLYSFCIDSCMEVFVSTAATVADFWSLLPRPTSIRSFCGPIPENTGGRSYICTES